MSLMEAIAAALGLINIVLIIRRSVWNYPFGLVMVSLYALVFFEAKLYSDMILQGFFCVVQLYGWVNWAQAKQGAAVPVRTMSLAIALALAGVTFAAWLIWSFAMDRWTDAAVPWVDGGIAMLSVTAQFMMARRYVENWVLWIVVDALAVPLFWSRGLLLTSGLYGLFLLLAVVGWVQWHRAIDRKSGAA